MKYWEYSPSDSYSESSLIPVPSVYDGHLSAEIASGTVKDLVGVAVLSGRGVTIVGVGSAAIVRVGRHFFFFECVAWSVQLKGRRMGVPLEME